MSSRTRTSRRASITAISALGLSLSLAIAACGGNSSSSANKVATLNNASAGATTTTEAVNTQEALLAYAACMRDNGIDMADPTFDADGNPSGGGFGGGGGGGANSNIDPRSTEFRTAQEACSSHLQGVTFGGRRGGNFDRQAVQDGLNTFTSCLRDNGLTVDDITFGRPPGASGTGGGAGGGGFGGPPPSDQVGGPPAGGSVPPGGFGGPPGDGQGPGSNGPGGAGFDPTARIIDRLQLDKTDPAVEKALAACQPILSSAFTPTSTTLPGG